MSSPWQRVLGYHPQDQVRTRLARYYHEHYCLTPYYVPRAAVVLVANARNDVRLNARRPHTVSYNHIQLSVVRSAQ